MSDLSAGPELDRLMAESFLPKGEWFVSSPRSDNVIVWNGDVWTPSTNIADSWEVVARMKLKGLAFHLYRPAGSDWIEASFDPPNLQSVSNGETAPLAICRAALKAVRG